MIRQECLYHGHFCIHPCQSRTYVLPSLLSGTAPWLFYPKSLQQPPKNRLYFKKVSPWSQIRDSRATLQHTDIQTINIIGQNIKPKMCYNFIPFRSPTNR